MPGIAAIKRKKRSARKRDMATVTSYQSVSTLRRYSWPSSTNFRNFPWFRGVTINESAATPRVILDPVNSSLPNHEYLGEAISKYFPNGYFRIRGTGFESWTNSFVLGSWSVNDFVLQAGVNPYIDVSVSVAQSLHANMVSFFNAAWPFRVAPFFEAA
jgi:hypothetical protein